VAVLLPGAVLLVTAGPVAAGAAGAPAIKGIGALNCASSGKVKFSPALGGSSASTSVKVNINLTACHGSNAGARVASGHVSGTVTGTPAGDCGVTEFTTTGTLTVTYDVKSGHPALKATTLSFNQVQSEVNDPGFEGQVSGAVTAGSFSDDGSFLDLQSAAGSPCAPKWQPGATSTFEEG
jgi:hypothetical protein